VKDLIREKLVDRIRVQLLVFLSKLSNGKRNRGQSKSLFIATLMTASSFSDTPSSMESFLWFPLTQPRIQ
jgi:hypothetical protein